MKHLLGLSLLLLAACGTDTGRSSGSTTGATDTGSGSDATDTGAGSGSGAADTGSADTGAGSGETVTTWHKDARAIVEQKCASCHNPEGTAGFSLQTYAEAEAVGYALADAVTTRRMPPWLPAGDCHPLQHSRALSEGEIATLQDWFTDGMPEGDVADYVAPAAPDVISLPPASLTLGTATGYTASRATPDDYRCLPLDYTFEADTFITASNILPGARSVVHHVLLYRVDAADVAELEAKDAAEPGPGYTCFGGPGVGGGETIAGWVPGQQPLVFPPNSALPIPAGSRIVMQMHYNTLGLAADAPVPADATRAELWTLPAGTTPQSVITINGLANTGIVIPAGEARSVQTKLFSAPGAADIVGVLPHMHQLGTEIRATLVKADGSEQCLVEIPRWDFNWQQFYRFEEDAALPYGPGDAVRLECVYDNSAANQAVIGGVRQEPRDVRWGENTTDEMCLNYVILRTPYEAPGGPLCPDFVDCATACAADDGGCFMRCILGGGSTGCASCLGGALPDCVRPTCPLQGLGLNQCMSGCTDGQVTCLTTTCAPQVDALWSCLRDPLLAGECNTAFESCGVGF